MLSEKQNQMNTLKYYLKIQNIRRKKVKVSKTQLLILIPLFLYQLIQRLRPIKIKIRQWTNRNYVYELWLVRKNK